MKNKIILMLLACVAFFPHNTALRPDIMECRNLVTAHEMSSGQCSWLVPTMNGELRLEKPMLPTWIAASVDCICPDSLSMQRVPPALAAMVWMLFLYLLMKRLTDEDTAFITSLVFLTCYQIVLMGRSATWDVYCHAFMTGGLYFLHRLLHHDGTEKARWFDGIWLGVMLGLSFLSKGPVSFFAMLFPFVLALPMLGKGDIRGAWPKVLMALVLAVLIGGWWYAYLYLAHPQELGAVMHKETGAWANRNVRPWYYYWRFFVEAGAWAPFVLAGLAWPLWRKRLKAGREYGFILVFMLAQLFLLSLMPEKKYRYLLPMMLPMSMLTGILLAHWKTQGSLWPKRILVGVVSIFVLVEVLAMPLVGRLFTGENMNTLSLLRHDERTADMPYFHPKEEELRIETVYSAGRRVSAMDMRDSLSVIKALPCVVLTHPEVTDSLLNLLPANIEKQRLGEYDDNHHPPTAKHYNPAMRYVATALKRKER